MVTILVHGGAGCWDRQRTEAPVSGVRAAADVGAAGLRSGEPALAAVVAAVSALEDDPTFNAGTGSSLTLDGRAEMDAAVLLQGDPDGSRLYERCHPLSEPAGGTEPNQIVTDLSSDSGRGPWWRRPLRFDAAAAGELRAVLATGHPTEDYHG